MEQFQHSFFGSTGFFFDDQLFDGFFKNLSNQFLFFESDKFFPLEHSKKIPFSSRIKDKAFFFPEQRFNYDFREKIFNNLELKNLYSLIYDDFISYYNKTLDLSIDKSLERGLEKKKKTFAKKQISVDYFTDYYGFSSKGSPLAVNKISHYDFSTNKFYFENQSNKQLRSFNNFCLNYGALTGLYIKPFIHTSYFKQFDFIRNSTLLENFLQNYYYKKYMTNLDVDMSKGFFSANFDVAKRHLDKKFYPHNMDLLLLHKKFGKKTMPRIGVMDWSFFFDFYRINNWNFNAVFSDDYDDDFLFFDYPGDAESIFHISYNTVVNNELFYIAFYGFFDTIFDCILAFLTFICYFLFMFFPSFFDSLLYEAIHLHAV